MASPDMPSLSVDINDPALSGSMATEQAQIASTLMDTIDEPVTTTIVCIPAALARSTAGLSLSSCTVLR